MSAFSEERSTLALHRTLYFAQLQSSYDCIFLFYRVYALLLYVHHYRNVLSVFQFKLKSVLRV